MQSYNLQGTIADTLDQLTYLQQLNLQGNFLYDYIPLSLDALLDLEVLNLSDYQLTGTIPTSLCQLTKLRQIYLDATC
jgi:hypothetical protein